MTTSTPRTGQWTVQPADPTLDEAVSLLRGYYTDIVDRYHRRVSNRPCTQDEIEQALIDFPSDDLTPPTGIFLIARHDDVPAGCAGFRIVAGDPTVGEVSRVFVDPAQRGLGGGAVLLDGLEHHARLLGLSTLRLDTRDDLVEARTLYAKHGYRPVPAFNDDFYAEHWFAKTVG